MSVTQRKSVYDIRQVKTGRMWGRMLAVGTAAWCRGIA